MSKSLVVGTMAYDAIETPFGKTDKTIGRSASYIALAASHFDVEVGIVSVGAMTILNKKHLDLMTNRNIDLSGVDCKRGQNFLLVWALPQRYEYP